MALPFSRRLLARPLKGNRDRSRPVAPGRDRDFCPRKPSARSRPPGRDRSRARSRFVPTRARPVAISFFRGPPGRGRGRGRQKASQQFATARARPDGRDRGVATNHFHFSSRDRSRARSRPGGRDLLLDAAQSSGYSYLSKYKYNDRARAAEPLLALSHSMKPARSLAPSPARSEREE